jgi:hypothetical protein
MDPATILADVQLAIQLAKAASDLGHDMAPYVITAYEIAFKNKILTAEERQVMTDQEIAWRASIDKTIADDDVATD